MINWDVMLLLSIASVEVALGLFLVGKAQESKVTYPNNKYNIHGLYVAASVPAWCGFVFVVISGILKSHGR